MTLQNRVNPFGDLVSVPQRGTFTGNRGVIHHPDTKTLLSRRWTTTAWIICSLTHPRGLRREPMGRNSPSGNAGWTELFFLDEVTALAAGHRPCFYCRRVAATRFQHCFAVGHGLDDAPAPEIDRHLHVQRLASPRPRLDAAEIQNLPSGAMISSEGKPRAIMGGRALEWSFEGYVGGGEMPLSAELLTPDASVIALRSGYQPVWHPSAGLR